VGTVWGLTRLWGAHPYLNAEMPGPLCSLCMLNKIFRYFKATPRQAKEEAEKTMNAAQCREYLDKTQENLAKYVKFLPDGPYAKADIPRDTILGIITGRLVTAKQYDPMAVSLDDETAQYPFHLLGDITAFPGTEHEQISLLVTPHTCDPKKGNVRPYLQHVDKGGLPLPIVYNMDKIKKDTRLMTNWTEFTHGMNVARRMAPPGSTIKPCKCSQDCNRFYFVPKNGLDFMESYAQAYQKVFQAAEPNQAEVEAVWEQMEACGGSGQDDAEVCPESPVCPEGGESPGQVGQVQPQVIKERLRQNPKKKPFAMTSENFTKEIIEMMGGYIPELDGFSHQELQSLHEEIEGNTELREMVAHLKQNPVQLAIKDSCTLSGDGVIAAQFIKEGTKFLPYWGALCRTPKGEVSSDYETRHGDTESTYSMMLKPIGGVKCFLSAAKTISNGEIQLANVNHCCTPTDAQIRKGVARPTCKNDSCGPLVFLVAMRDIHPGEEITYSYGDVYWKPLSVLRKKILEEDEFILECLCHNGNCPKKCGRIRNRSGLRFPVPLAVAQPIPAGAALPDAPHVFLDPAGSCECLLGSIDEALAEADRACLEAEQACAAARAITLRVGPAQEGQDELLRELLRATRDRKRRLSPVAYSRKARKGAPSLGE